MTTLDAWASVDALGIDRAIATVRQQLGPDCEFRVTVHEGKRIVYGWAPAPHEGGVDADSD